MPRAVPMAIREQVVLRHRTGSSALELSREYGLSRQTIYNILDKSKSGASLHPDYEYCGKVRPRAGDFIYRAVRCLRTWHPSWGAEKIRAYMQLLRPELSLPHYRTFTRWFHWNSQITPRLRSTLPPTPHKWAKKLHEIWQIDAKEEMQLLDGKKACWLNVVDEFSGTVISPPVFSL
ncbi:MAG: hypothetical protein AAGI49_20320 [Bacteroidota bacterium]